MHGIRVDAWRGAGTSPAASTGAPLEIMKLVFNYFTAEEADQLKKGKDIKMSLRYLICSCQLSKGKRTRDEGRGEQ